MEVRLDLFAIALIGLASATGCAGGDSAPDAGVRPGSPDPRPGANDAAPPDAYTADPEASVFTGELQGTDARVAVIATKHRARLYFCGGDTTYTMLSRWVTADLTSNGAVTTDANAVDWSIDATVGTSVDGTLTTGDDTVYPFTASRIEKKTMGGLYEAVSPCGKVGVIVSQPTESDAPVVQGACIKSPTAADIHQVNPVLPLTRNPDGSISVVVAGETEEISVVPAAAPAN